ncbi:MAG: bifunctional diaminohydroxyphosphoribosylaminopyrimidine deaminase/5-amino-6-(5-phosphoribosylamino)uracil reductase RibD, partial [Pontimonas sp.]
MRSSTLAVSSSELDAMRRALTIAKKGALNGGNPRVGCVLLDSEGSVVAEGFHRGAGHPHAEVEALHELDNSGLTAEGLTAVVTLEPCNHHGKTGPCTQALIEAGVSRVVFGASDPGEDSSGGEEVLGVAGIEVIG